MSWGTAAVGASRRRNHIGGGQTKSLLSHHCGRSGLTRILWIHQRLANERSATSASLAQALGVSVRTIKRDIEMMRDSLGAPIVWEPSTHTYFYNGPCDLLPLLRLDADETLALILAGRTFAAWRGSPLGQALNGAFAKIAQVAGGSISLPADGLKDLIFQPEGAAEAETEGRVFAIALDAIRRRRVLRLNYRKPGRKMDETRLIHPLHLAFLDHRWMLIAFDPGRRAPRNFLLTRIQGANPTTERFSLPVGFDLAANLRGSLGRFTGEGEYEVRIACDATIAPYLREHPWHSSQVITERTNGSIEVSLRLNNLIDVQRRILACGRHAEVLAPAELREALRAEARAMAAHYEAETSGALFASKPSALAAEPPQETYSQGQPMSHPS